MVSAAIVLPCLGASGAGAADGLLEINQTCAAGAGCFPGDDPDFPVEITSAGSYVLTSSLTVTGATSAISVTASGVSLDLKGFEIAGPASCKGEGTTIVCNGPIGGGISAAGSASRTTVRNGTVRNFRSTGVGISSLGEVEDLIVEENGGTGISGGLGTIVSNSVARRNGGTGIAASIIRDSYSSGNGLDGFSSGLQCSVVGNVAEGNGRIGFLADGACIVRENTSRNNGADGFFVSGGSVVSENSAFDNATNGIRMQGRGSTIQRSTVVSNTGAGLQLTMTVDTTYRENTISDNGATVAGGVDMGANSCNGNPTCTQPPP